MKCEHTFVEFDNPKAPFIPYELYKEPKKEWGKYEVCIHCGYFHRKLKGK